ncbi:hypothetical protein ACFQ3Z_15980 [Streptomyces nogalater]
MLAIEIGTKLIPVVTSVVAWFGQHKDVAVALAAVIGGVLVLSVVAYAAKLTMSAAKTVVSFGKMGVSAVKAARTSCAAFGPPRSPPGRHPGRRAPSAAHSARASTPRRAAPRPPAEPSKTSP